MFLSKAMTTSEGINYSSASVGVRVLMSRYLPVRAMMEDVFYRKVFLPVALANQFFERKKADLAHHVRTSTGDPIYPRFNWRHKQSLLDDAAIKSSLIQLRDKGDIPLKVLCDGLDLDYEEILSWLEKEQGTIADRSLSAGRTQYVTKLVQNTTIKKILNTIKRTFLPRDAEKVPEDDGSPDPVAPAPMQPPTTPAPKPPASMPTPTESSTGTTQTVETTNPPKDTKPRDPLGGPGGEKVEGNPTDNVARRGPLASYKHHRDIRAARKPASTAVKACSCGHHASLTDSDVPDLNDWQLRLRMTEVDPSSRRDMVSTEDSVMDTYDSNKDFFVKMVMDSWSRGNYLTMDMLQNAVRDTVENVNAVVSPDLASNLKTVYDRSSSSAAEKMRVSKRGRARLRRKAYLSSDRQLHMDVAIDNALQRVTTVSEEVLEKIREKLHSSQDDIPADITKALFAELSPAEFEGLTENEIAAKVGELWDQQRYVYQRIVRTEMMNTYARASLQEWFDAGYTKVIRREINDNKTCTYCRTVDGMEYKIADLLELDYPLIQDAITKEYVGHPHCRGTFVLKFDDWDYFIAPPGETYDVIRDVLSESAQVSGVPAEYASAIENALAYNSLGKDVIVTPDIVDHPDWLTAERERITKEMGKGVSQIRVDSELADVQESLRGQLASYELPTGEVLMSGSSVYDATPSWLVVRLAARDAWNESDTVREAVTALYDMRKKLAKSTLDEDGIEIIGSPSTDAYAGFFNVSAAIDPQNYFVEGYSTYQTDSYKLEFVDLMLYQYLKDSVFNGREFRGSMVIS
jgi:SPP1 gp7 family putative phage head morphogenesis protein